MRSSFTGALTITELAIDWRQWRLEQPLSYDPGYGQLITVPAGFVTDGASVPGPLRWLLPAWGKYSRAAVIHDFLCELYNSGTPFSETPTRKQADLIFLDAMNVSDVGWFMRTLIYSAVRLEAIWYGKK